MSALAAFALPFPAEPGSPLHVSAPIPPERGAVPPPAHTVDSPVPAPQCPARRPSWLLVLLRALSAWPT
jgi:hypothetical protein